MRFRLISTVWGPSFTDLFLRTAVRSLLAEGNVDVLGAKYPTEYTIFTSEESAADLRSAPIFQRLAGLVHVDLVSFRPGEIDAKNPSSHWIAWRRGAEIARANREIAFFIIPDMIYGTGTFARWAGFFEQGYRAVWSPATQVVLETALAEIEGRYPAHSSAPLPMSAADIMSLTIRHLHPTMVTMFRDTQRLSRHPEVAFSVIPGHGLAMRAIGSHPFCVDPHFFSMSDAFSPLNHLEAIRFDDPRGVGLEPLLKAPDLYARVAPLNADRISNMGSWLDFFCTPSDMLASMHTFCFSPSENCRGPEFRRVDAALAFFACQVRITGGIYRVVKKLAELKCHTASKVIATAHYAGRLRRRWTVRGPVTLLVPDDKAMDLLGSDRLDELLSGACNGDLVEFVLQHALPGRHPFRPGDEISPSSRPELAAANGTRMHLATGARIVSGPFEEDDCTIYVIDRPLAPARRHDGAKARLRMPGKWTVNPHRLFTAAPELAPEPEPIPDHPQLPPPRAPAPDVHLFAKVFAPGERPLRRVGLLSWWIARTGYRGLRRVPGAGPFANSLKRGVARQLERVPAIVRLVRSSHYENDRATERAFAVRSASIQPAEVAVPEPLAAPLPAPAAAADEKTGLATPELIECFHDCQYARLLLTMQEVYHFYRERLQGLVAEIPPLDLIETYLGENDLTVDRVVALLNQILRRAPNFAEAWYELGDIHMSRGELQDALSCFQQCLLSERALPILPGRSDYYEMAASGKATILHAKDQIEEAADLYRDLIQVYGHTGITCVLYARLLQRLGRPQEAASEFLAGMAMDHRISPFPPLSRDFGVLATRLQGRFGTGSVPATGPTRACQSQPS